MKKPETRRRELEYKHDMRHVNANHTQSNPRLEHEHKRRPRSTQIAASGGFDGLYIIFKRSWRRRLTENAKIRVRLAQNRPRAVQIPSLPPDVPEQPAEPIQHQKPSGSASDFGFNLFYRSTISSLRPSSSSSFYEVINAYITSQNHKFRTQL